MIVIESNDGVVLNRDCVIVDIVARMTSGSSITISMNNEGPCLEALGVYSLLDMLCDRFSYPKQDICIKTNNLLETHKEYNIVKSPTQDYFNSAKKHADQHPTTKIFNEQTKHFGHFIGHGNYHRLRLASYLFSHHQDKAIQSYHYKQLDDYHRSFVGLEDMLYFNHSWQNIEAACNLLKHAPLTVDTVESYPILNPATLNITKVYPSFFVELCSLTYFSGNTFRMDEKICRPIIANTPFMIQGPQNYIKNLRRAGFKTFYQWWDEGYSEDPSDCQVEPIIDNINRLAKLSIAELSAMYNDMQPTLEHNRNLLLDLTEQTLTEIFK